MPPWQIELLDTSRHDRKTFRCGEEDLDRYLAQIARQADKQNTGRTYVAIDLTDQGDTAGRRQVAGYFTLAMTAIALEALPQAQRRSLPKQVPAALLARLAVDQRHQRQGLGEYLLIIALHQLVAAADKVAAHVIVVDVLNQKAKDFYLKYEFNELADDPMHLFLPMEIARRLKP